MEKFQLVNFEEVKDITSEEYFSGESFAYDTFNSKYCLTINGKKETPARVFWRIASGLANQESAYSQEMVKDLTNTWFSLMWYGWFRPGGSVMSGVGNPKDISLLNCTTIPLTEDTLNSIYKCESDMAVAAAYRQGLGVDGSKLRPRGAPVNNAAEESTGAVPWLTKLSEIGKYVGQRGRYPAVLLSLNVNHPDVEEFITAKTELGNIESANISVQITDAFMDAVINDEDWELRFDFENNLYDSVVKNVRATVLFDLISKTAFETAEPGVQYIDRMKEGSMVQQVYEATGNKAYELISTNACSEKILPPYGVCNLLSLNMEMFSTDLGELVKELEYVVPYLVRLSDNVVSYELNNNLSPLPEQRVILEKTREVGLGITNLHGYLLKHGVAYDSNEAIYLTECFMSNYANIVFKTSVELGKEKGSAYAWDLVKDKSVFMKSSYFRNIVNTFYEGDFTRVTHMRNMAHMSIAPTGSVSNTFPTTCLSSGIESLISYYYWRRTRAVDKGSWTHYFIVPKRVKEYVLSKLKIDSMDYQLLSAFSGSERDEDGKIGNNIKDIIDRNLPPGFFKPAHEIDPIQKVRLMSKAYKWIDACVSCTYNLPSTATVEDVKNIYMEGYKQGVRAISVYVDGCREGVLLFEDPKTNASKFKASSDKAVCGERPLSIVVNCAPRRPKALTCDIHHTSVQGEMYLVMVGLMDGHPFEIFAGPAEDLYLPKSCTEGTILKEGDGHYALEVMIRKSPVVYKDLASVLMSDDEKALTRLLSLNLRHGVPPRYIVEQLRKSNGNITAFSTAVSRVLSRYIGTYKLDKEKNKCPKCGETSLMFVEGCVKCMAECGYSRCG